MCRKSEIQYNKNNTLNTLGLVNQIVYKFPKRTIHPVKITFLSDREKWINYELFRAMNTFLIFLDVEL